MTFNDTVMIGYVALHLRYFMTVMIGYVALHLRYFMTFHDTVMIGFRVSRKSYICDPNLRTF